MSLLDDATILRELEVLPGWRREGKTIWRLFQFEEFMDGVRFVNRIAEEAERQNHHPDMHVGYGMVKVITWSHDLDGITERDFRLAHAIEEIARG